MYNDITGIILSGGKSTRMGENKALLKLGGKTIIDNIAKLMQRLFGRVLLITNNPEDYGFLNLEIFMDVYKNVGPLAGIYSGLVHSTTQKNFIISCDMPLVTEDIIKFITEYPTKKTITITKADGYLQQLCGIYSKECLSEIESIIEENNIAEVRNSEQKKRMCKVLSLVDKAGAEIIDVERECDGYKQGTFFNMNKPEEYEKILGLYQTNKLL